MRAGKAMNKKYISMLLAVAILLTFFCSCGKNKDTSSADTYLAMAQEFLNANDIDSALDVLQKGFDTTGDERISEMITRITAQTTETEATGNEVSRYSSYEGTWAEEGIGWEYGGLILDITENSNAIIVDVAFTQGAPSSRVSNFSISLPTSEIHNEQFEAVFENDGWDNSGTIVLHFSEDTIFCTIKDTKHIYDGLSGIWGIYEGDYLLTKQADAHNKLSYTMDEYYEMYPENNPDNWEDDTAVTIDELKNSCLLLSLDSLKFIYSTLTPVTTSDLIDDKNYLNCNFVPCEPKTEYIVCPACLGSGFKEGNPEKGTCKNKGHRDFSKTENGIHYIYHIYPDQAITSPITISSVVTLSGQPTVYKVGERINIYDARIDQSASLSAGASIVPYMTYLGEIDDVLQFSMFACDITG